MSWNVIVSFRGDDIGGKGIERVRAAVQKRLRAYAKMRGAVCEAFMSRQVSETEGFCEVMHVHKDHRDAMRTLLGAAITEAGATPSAESVPPPSR